MPQLEQNPEFGTIVSESLSPGAMLKHAREAKKLSHIDVAKQLKLRVQWILDIENDHYSDASALIYVRGYLRGYARVVNLPPEEVIAAFDAMKFDEPFLARKSQASVPDEQFVMQQTVLSYSKSKSQKGAGKKIIAWIILIIVLLALALAIMWWRGEHQAIHHFSANQSTTVSLAPVEQTVSGKTIHNQPTVTPQNDLEQLPQISASTQQEDESDTSASAAESNQSD